jgi:hypothetical protein
MNEIMQGFKTLENAQIFRESVVGDYLIVGLYENLFSKQPFAYFLKENTNGL